MVPTSFSANDSLRRGTLADRSTVGESVELGIDPRDATLGERRLKVNRKLIVGALTLGVLLILAGVALASGERILRMRRATREEPA